jgi:ABC-type lipoprotein release transport system permease subunit
VLLDDPSKTPDTMLAIEQLNATQKLGIQAIDWQAASGLVGQLILVIRLILYTAIFIIFLVALVIINNSMVMATMERVAEIGTMRAIGAQRSTVLALTILEALMLCGIAGTLGGLLGIGLVALLGSSGIPAQNDVMVFVFGGPALHPTVGMGNVLFAVVTILIVSLFSTLYPAIVATRVQPVVAMSRGN